MANSRTILGASRLHEQSDVLLLYGGVTCCLPPFGQFDADGPALECRPELVVSPVIHLHIQSARRNFPAPLEGLWRHAFTDVGRVAAFNQGSANEQKTQP